MYASRTPITQAFGTPCRTLFLKKANTVKHLPLLLATLLLAVSCNHNSGLTTLSGKAQGTFYTIIYSDPLHRNLQPSIDSLLDQFDLTASLWVDSSLIRRINSNSDTLISPLFCDILNKSQQINLYTHGAFDCRIGSLVNLYGFGFKERETVTQSQIDTCLSLLRPDSYTIDSTSLNGTTQYILHKHPLIEFDFNAIAQGYAVDLVAQMLDNRGIHNYMVDIGGEVITRGLKPNNQKWSIGIERPSENKYSEQTIETVIQLTDLAVVTSGNYRKYYEKDGTRYSHTIDPSTGRPVTHSLLSVSVVSRQSWYADAMATSFMVMGLDKSLKFIQDHSDNPDIQAVFFIYDDHGTYKTHATPAFQKLISNPPTE